MLSSFSDWLALAPLWVIGLVIFGGLIGAALIAGVLRRRRQARKISNAEQGEESITVSAVTGLLALLIAFTFSIALERFDTRRTNVLREANAIGTTYLRAQLLDEPHRTRVSNLLVTYTDTRITLATGHPGPEQRERLKTSDKLITDLWSATVAAFPSIRSSSFAQSFLQTMNELIDMDASRKAGRDAHVPGAVFFALFIYQFVAAGVISFVVDGKTSRRTAWILFALLGLLLLLIIDIDRPTSGGITESQEPMLQLQSFLKQQPPGSFDRYTRPASP
jgi:protein-S-isoprenylcysteine O-methyltransferase Ste14